MITPSPLFVRHPIPWRFIGGHPRNSNLLQIYDANQNLVSIGNDLDRHGPAVQALWDLYQILTPEQRVLLSLSSDS